ncbi:MAG: SDR family NAD(P)-dependent oxidoreductase [Eubacteriales bacterium]
MQTNDSPTVLITGASTGLVFACARNIAFTHPNCTIIIAGRNRQRITDAAKKINMETGATKTIPMLLDLASLSSVRLFVEEFLKANLPPLASLVCNAGIRPTQHIETTQDGYEAVFGVNYLGHFLLTNLLLPHMAQGARILLLSSRTHDYRDKSPFPKSEYKKPSVYAIPHTPEGEKEKSFVVRAYSNSKLCVTMFGFELSRRMQAAGRNILVNVFDPGAMATDIVRDYGQFISHVMRILWPAIRILPNMSSIKESARVLAELAVSDKYNGITGKYFTMIGSYCRGAKEADPSPLVFDLEKTKELWDGSEELINI